MALLLLLSPAMGVGVRWSVAAAGVTPAQRWRCDAGRCDAPWQRRSSPRRDCGDTRLPPPPPWTVTSRAHAAPRRCATACVRQQTPAAGRAQAALRSAWTCSITVHTHTLTYHRGRSRRGAGTKRVNAASDAHDRTRFAYSRATRRQRKCGTGRQSGRSRFHVCGAAVARGRLRMVQLNASPPPPSPLPPGPTPLRQHASAGGSR
jgi:hypothetical protein